jgi:hypothetical protein
MAQLEWLECLRPPLVEQPESLAAPQAAQLLLPEDVRVV